MTPTHDDLHHLETRIDGRIQAERAERIQADDAVEERVRDTILALHQENKSTSARIETKTDRLEIKLDQLLEKAGVSRGAKSAGLAILRGAGWFVATALATWAAFHHS